RSTIPLLGGRFASVQRCSLEREDLDIRSVFHLRLIGFEIPSSLSYRTCAASVAFSPQWLGCLERRASRTPTCTKAQSARQQRPQVRTARQGSPRVPSLPR